MRIFSCLAAQMFSDIFSFENVICKSNLHSLKSSLAREHFPLCKNHNQLLFLSSLVITTSLLSYATDGEKKMPFSVTMPPWSVSL